MGGTHSPGKYDCTIRLYGGDAPLCQITLTTCYLWTRPLTQSADSRALRVEYSIVGILHNAAI